MKVFWLTLSAAMVSALMIAQTNLPSSSALTTRASTHIFADAAEFDLKTRVVVYGGNVRVEDAQLKLWCELLTATAPAKGGRVENITAERNVVIDMFDENNQTNHATGGKLVYTYKVADGITNEMAVLTINPRLETPDGMTIIGDAISWNLLTSRINVTNPKMSGRADVIGGTNQPSPAFETPSQ